MSQIVSKALDNLLFSTIFGCVVLTAHSFSQENCIYSLEILKTMTLFYPLIFQTHVMPFPNNIDGIPQNLYFIALCIMMEMK